MEVEDLILQISIGANSFDQIPLSNLASFWKKSPIARAQEIIRLCNFRRKLSTFESQLEMPLLATTEKNRKLAKGRKVCFAATNFALKIRAPGLPDFSCYNIPER
jgi:hypothetical protein